MGCCCCTVVVIGWVKGGVAQLMMTMVRKRRRSEGGGGRRRGVLRICTVQYEQKNYLLCIIRYGVVCGEEKGSQSQFMFFSCLSIYLPKPCMHGRMHTNVIHYFSDQTLSTSTHTHTLHLQHTHDTPSTPLRLSFESTNHHYYHTPQPITKSHSIYIHQNGNLTKIVPESLFVIVVVAMTPQLPKAVTPVSLVSLSIPLFELRL